MKCTVYALSLSLICFEVVLTFPAQNKTETTRDDSRKEHTTQMSPERQMRYSVDMTDDTLKNGIQSLTDISSDSFSISSEKNETPDVSNPMITTADKIENKFKDIWLALRNIGNIMHDSNGKLTIPMRELYLK